MNTYVGQDFVMIPSYLARMVSRLSSNYRLDKVQTAYKGQSIKIHNGKGNNKVTHTESKVVEIKQIS